MHFRGIKRRCGLFAIAIAVGTSVGLSACSGSGSSSPAPTSSDQPLPSDSASATPANGVPVTFKTTVTSTYDKSDKVGPKNGVQYGVNVLQGTTKINDRTVTVRMLATQDYQDGSGPLGGFLQLIWSDGTTIGMRQEGKATYDSGEKKTEYSARLDVINGSDKAVGTDGTGSWTGKSSGSTGKSISMSVTLYLTGAPESLTGSAPVTTASPTESYSATLAP